MSDSQSISVNLKKYKNVDERIRDLINGYIRRIQSLFPHKISYYIIPLNINYIVTLFYFINFEELAEELNEDTAKLLEIVKDNDLFKDMTKYCIKKHNDDLWNKVLSKDNKHRKSLIDEIIIQLPQSTIPEEVASCIKSIMMTDDLKHELIEILERIMINGNNVQFKNNKNLQNLLMLTAIKADPAKVSGYIDIFDNYDGFDLAKICISETYQLYEEGFLFYKKGDHGSEAINVLLYDLLDIERAKEFASCYNKPEVWSILGKAQLDNDLVTESMKTFLKSTVVEHYNDVILSVNKCNKIELYVELIEFLNMARKKVKVDKDKRNIDSELIYLLAKTENLTEFENFISTQDSLNGYMMMKIGDRLFDDGLFSSAKVIFTKISHYAKINACNTAIKQINTNNT